MSDIVDVAIETNEGNFYQFLSMPMPALLRAIERIGTGEVLSMVNLDSAAIVVPNHTIRKIQVVSVLVEARDESSWSIVWERPLEEKPKKIRKPRRKATHG
jgi:hypothetical protein